MMLPSPRLTYTSEPQPNVNNQIHTPHTSYYRMLIYLSLQQRTPSVDSEHRFISMIRKLPKGYLMMNLEH